MFRNGKALAIFLIVLGIALALGQEPGNNYSFGEDLSGIPDANISFVKEITVNVQPPSVSPAPQEENVTIQALLEAGQRLLYPILHYLDNLWGQTQA